MSASDPRPAVASIAILAPLSWMAAFHTFCRNGVLCRSDSGEMCVFGPSASLVQVRTRGLRDVRRRAGCRSKGAGEWKGRANRFKRGRKNAVLHCAARCTKVYDVDVDSIGVVDGCQKAEICL